MDTQALEKMSSHLEFLGYEIGENTGERMRATHAQKANISIFPGAGGFFMQAFYNMGEKAKQDRNGFLEAINEINNEAIVARFYISLGDEPSLGIDVWMPSRYDKVEFGAFMEAWDSDTKRIYHAERMKAFI